MEVYLTAEQEAQLIRIADSTGRAVEAVAQEAIRRLLEEEAHFVEAVEKGFASLDRGEYVEHEEVGARIKRLLGS
jgi:predicted transcriptional regulator